MSPETAHKLMGFYMEVLILGVILQYIGCIGLNNCVSRLSGLTWSMVALSGIPTKDGARNSLKSFSTLHARCQLGAGALLTRI